MRLIITIFLALTGFSCTEPYDFRVENNEPALVVEGYISNRSYADTREYPSDGRYFSVILRLSGDVSHDLDSFVTHAAVSLIDDTGASWSYTESSERVGHYLLRSDEFKASADRAYKLKISLPEGESYESEWERIAEVAPEMGTIGFEETTRQVYAIEASEEVVKTIKGINVYISIPENKAGNPLYYRWNFEPLWIYIAPLASPSQDNYLCWATNKNYLAGYALQQDHVGGYKKNLFFVESIRNERIFERLSVLVTQQALSQDNYSFWKEMQEQAERNPLLDIPLYNLNSNMKSVSGNKKVHGYFSVVDEQAKRWYFSTRDLSYYVQNTLKPDCEVSYGPGPPAPSCTSCLDYHNGQATNRKPYWWEN